MIRILLDIFALRSVAVRQIYEEDAEVIRIPLDIFYDQWLHARSMSRNLVKK